MSKKRYKRLAKVGRFLRCLWNMDFGWSDRLYKIQEEMYYEQADRDGCDYPPQFRG